MIAAAPTTTVHQRAAGVLAMLLGDGDHELAIEARTEAGFGAWSLSVRPIERSDLQIGLLPVALLQLLEDHRDVAVTVSPAARSLGNPAYVAATHVAFARWVLEPVFSGSSYRVSSEARSAIDAHLEAFPCPASAVIDAGREVIALWRLEHAIDLTDEAGAVRAHHLQHGLGRALQASLAPMRHIIERSGGNRLEMIPACDHVGFVPLCGIQRELGSFAARPLVFVRDLQPLTYTVAHLEAALAAPTTPTARRTDRGAHTSKGQ